MVSDSLIMSLIFAIIKKQENIFKRKKGDKIENIHNSKQSYQASDIMKIIYI